MLSFLSFPHGTDTPLYVRQLVQEQCPSFFTDADGMVISMGKIQYIAIISSIAIQVSYQLHSMLIQIPMLSRYDSCIELHSSSIHTTYQLNSPSNPIHLLTPDPISIKLSIVFMMIHNRRSFSRNQSIDNG